MDKKCKRCNLIIFNVSPQRLYCEACIKTRKNEQHRHYMTERAIRENLRCVDCGTQLSWHSGKREQAKKCQECYRKTVWGPNSPAWRGGRKVDKDGYIFIWHPAPHPRRIGNLNRNGRKTYYVAEHILNWEQHHNMPLPNGYTVHHLNGIKSANRPANLVALQSTRHSSGLVNEVLQERIRFLENQLAQQRLL